MSEIQQLLPEFLQVARTERATLIGKTGSGKTTLARYLLEPFKFIVILDLKGTIDWDGYKLVTDFTRLTKERFPRLIFRPSARLLRDEKLIDDFFWWIYHRKNTTLYVDEVYSVVSGNWLPDGYHALLTRGRERNITLISSTQRPTRIPTEILSEAERLYVFRLRMFRDREKIINIDSEFSDDGIAKLHNRFFYYSHYDDGVTGPYILDIK